MQLSLSFGVGMRAFKTRRIQILICLGHESLHKGLEVFQKIRLAVSCSRVMGCMLLCHFMIRLGRQGSECGILDAMSRSWVA